MDVPSHAIRKTAEGVYVDVAFPINRETRALAQGHVMRAY